MFETRDVTLKKDRVRELLLDKHEKYLRQYADDESGTDQIMSEYLKMSGIYWGLNALYLMDRISIESDVVLKTLEFIKRGQNSDGGFAAAMNHDSHILHTLSAVQVLVILNKCHTDSSHIDIDKCVKYIKSLHQPDGSFYGDKWGEVDTRFSFCALATLKLLDRLHEVNTDKAADFVMRCNNQIDGGFGSKPGSESHSAYVYCCVGALALVNKLHLVDADTLGWWLSERQLPSGGLNGRPEKLPDLCYSWWCLSSMKMIDRMHLIKMERLLEFILACQDEEHGGFSDRPGNMADPYHTMFGIASISLICQYYNERAETKTTLSEKTSKILDDLASRLKPVNPVLCMPQEQVTHIKFAT
jgi:geranylgeranyl transferase type-2 subunit beta